MLHQVDVLAIRNVTEVVEEEVDLWEQLVNLLEVVILQTTSQNVSINLTLGVALHRGNHHCKFILQVLVTGKGHVDCLWPKLVAAQFNHVRLKLLVGLWKVNC